MSENEGASLGEQLIEAVRRNNLELLEDTLGHSKDPATLINETQDPIGNSILHIAAANGSYETLDHILDQEGVEVDPVNRLAGEIPLHCAVRYAGEEPEHGGFIVEVLIEAGADPRIKNNKGQKPIDLVHGTNFALRDVLQGAELALMLGPDQEDPVEDEGEEGESDDD